MILTNGFLMLASPPSLIGQRTPFLPFSDVVSDPDEEFWMDDGSGLLDDDVPLAKDGVGEDGIGECVPSSPEPALGEGGAAASSSAAPLVPPAPPPKPPSSFAASSVGRSKHTLQVYVSGGKIVIMRKVVTSRLFATTLVTVNAH